MRRRADVILAKTKIVSYKLIITKINVFNNATKSFNDKRDST